MHLNKFEKLVFKITCKFLPAIFVENYKDNIKIVRDSVYPQKAKFVFAKSSLTFDRWGILALISLDMTKILWKAGNNFNAAIPYTDTVAKKLVKSSPALLTRTIPKTRSNKIIEYIINLGICDKAKIFPLICAISKLVLSKFESTFT